MIHTIERKVGEAVSPEMLQEAKNLRNLAASIENGTAVAVAYTWVSTADAVAQTYSTFNADSHCFTLLGSVSVMHTKMSTQMATPDDDD